MGLRGNPDPVDAPEWKTARAAIEAHYLWIDQRLQGREYLADQFSYADIAFYMAQFFAARHTVPMTAAHPNLLAWRERMIGRPAVRTVVTAMVGYLRSQGRSIPELGGRAE
jgi:glutathione S-transferase